jgi:hypothetical protein
LKKTLRRMKDCVVPTLDGSPRRHEVLEKRKRRQRLARFRERLSDLSHSTSLLEELVDEVDDLVDSEQGRRQSVDTRLTTIIGLMSIAATIVVSGLLVLATGTSVPETLWVRWTIAIALLYLALQLAIALANALWGVTRHSAKHVSLEEIVPSPHLSPSDVYRQRMVLKAELLEDAKASTDRKLGRLAVAHQAVLNFIVGLFVLAAASALIAATRVAQAPVVPCCTPGTPAQPRPTASVIRLVATIGPFGSGDHEVNLPLTRACVQRVAGQLDLSAAGGWLVVGRVDKRALLPAGVRRYGSNQSLAMVRANWVFERVLPAIDRFAPAQSVVMVGGARSLDGSENALSVDRAVDVYVLTTEDAGLARPSLRPIACP